MTERSGAFSAGVTGVPVTNTNIVLDESYKTMNQSASSSSPAQNQDHTTTDNMDNTVTATVANINTHSTYLWYESEFNYSQSGGESPQPPLFGFPVYNSQSDGESLGAIRRSGASDSEDYNSFRKLNLDNDWVRPGGERLSSNNSNDVWSVGSRDRQRSLSGDSGYHFSQDSGVAAEDDMSWDVGDLLNGCYPEPDFSSILDQCDKSWGLLPDNVTTSNSNPPQPPQIVIEKNHQGEVAREMTNGGLITDLSSCNNIDSVPQACDDEDEILSPESSGVEVSSESLLITTESLVITAEGNSEVESHHVPEIGMKFSSEDEALKFYKRYAMEIGFEVRKGKVQRLPDKSIAKRYFYCSKEGFRSKKQPTKTKKFTRKETRTGCKAMIKITLKNEEWSISHFIPEHNHDIKGLTQRFCIDLSSKIPEADSLIQSTCEIKRAKEAEAGACAKFCNMSYSKHLHAKKSNKIPPKDAQGLIDYLKKLQVKDLSFFYTFQVDDECHMKNFFWRDSRSKIDYYYFGDVLILDTTFKTDQYNMICAPFLGLNHHGQHVLFGCAFLLDESVESFTWLLGTFMEAMGRHQPKTIFTTEFPAISKAVELTLPKSQHLICKQFVLQNAKQHLSMYYGHPEFERDFYCCLFANQSKEKFHSSWSSLLEKYNLRENPWLQNIYTSHLKWSCLFCKMTFCAGIDSNQWHDYFSKANVFQNAKSEAMVLWEYVLEYEKAAEHQRKEELQSSASEPMLILNSPMEKQAAMVYTPTMFKIFRDELIGTMSLPLKCLAKTGSVITFKTKGTTECIVEINYEDITITCSCKKFESVGILCAHALKVLNTRNIFQIPQQYILKRWTKFAKDGVVEGDYYGEEIADNSESLCKGKFMQKALNVIAKSVAVKKTRKIAERYLDIALKEVDDELKKGKEHHNTKDAEVNYEGVKNTSSVARVDWQEKVVEDPYLSQGETSKGTMEFQIQKKRKNEVREKMDPPSSSMSLP